MRSPVHKLFQDYATIDDDEVSWFHLDWLVAASVVGPVAPVVDPVAPDVDLVAPEVGRMAPEVGLVNAEVEAVVSAIGVAAVVARQAMKRHVSHCRRCASR